jgi:SAM-dependent methyltransferase
MRLRPDLSVQGIDVLVRDKTWIPVESFDGRHIPFENASFDAVMFVDVLHHAEDAVGLLNEAIRVSRHTVLIKDHTLEGFLAGPTLRFMDRTGNLHHGISMRYEYWTRQRWLRVFESLKVMAVWKHHLGIYPWPARWIFERTLHFIARLEVSSGERPV